MAAVAEPRFSSHRPEDFLVGLHVPKPGSGREPSFGMPRLEKVSGTSVMVTALYGLVADPRQLKLVKDTAVRFVPAGTPQGMVVHGLSQLVDVVLKDLLATADKTSFRAALTALEDARAEPQEHLKQGFRVEARGALREAYLRFEDAMAEKQDSLTYRASRGRFGEGALRNLHDLATQTALAIAMISHLEGSWSAARTWSDRARDQFAAYADSLADTLAVNVGNRVERGVTTANRAVRRLPALSYGMPRNVLTCLAPLASPGTGVAMLGLEICRRSYARLEEDRRAFDRVHRYLTQPGTPS